MAEDLVSYLNRRFGHIKPDPGPTNPHMVALIALMTAREPAEQAAWWIVAGINASKEPT